MANPVIPERGEDVLLDQQPRPALPVADPIRDAQPVGHHADVGREQLVDIAVVEPAGDLRARRLRSVVLASGFISFGTTARNTTVGDRHAASLSHSRGSIAATISRPTASGSIATRRMPEVPALRLFAFDGLEQRLEVADPETARAVPLDDLEKNVGRSWTGA